MKSALFSPFTLRDLKLDNRIVVSPMCQYSATDGNATDWHLMHLGQYSVSGAGLVITEATAVESRGRISYGDLGLYSNENEEAFERIIKFFRHYGSARIGVQLAHSGRKGSDNLPWKMNNGPLGLPEGAWKTVAPSALSYNDGWPAPKALDATGLAEVKKAFVDGVKRAARLGFDLVELHSAHGYLLHQFLSPLSNQRTDEYGGSLTNRMRFPLEVFSAVREVWPERKPLGVRISASDYAAGGWTITDSLVYASELKKRGCDYIDVSGGGLVPYQETPVGPGYQVRFSEVIRKETGVPTMAVGMITKPVQAEEIISTGKADMVALGRAMLYDTRWAWHAASELGAEAKYPRQYLMCKP
ncbi:MAG: NADH:flavin oxidoreductase/NADH oxidase [Deltaproteobacteria bacterium]|nr:NADH:flavin oxidoreductase/NADH oxidase [Deltaproteobacteria bacterium]